jgi:hypothetical protein
MHSLVFAKYFSCAFITGKTRRSVSFHLQARQGSKRLIAAAASVKACH